MIILNASGKREDFNLYIQNDHEKNIEKLLAIVDRKGNQNLGNKAINAERPITSISQSSLFTGDRIFDVESGILASWWRRLEKKNMPLEMFPFTPGLVGHKNINIINGKKSGIDTIYYKAEKMNLTLSEKEALASLNTLKKISLARKGTLNDEELKAIMEKE